MKVIIHYDQNYDIHSTSWVFEWESKLQEYGVDYEVQNCYEGRFVDKIKDASVLLWYFDNYNALDMAFAKSYIKLAEKMGVLVFPDIETIWFYDDKISQSLCLDTFGIEQPEWWCFYNKKNAHEWLEKTISFPVIAKLKSGSGSNNVKMLNNIKEVRKYVNRMFGRGFSSVPSILWKIRSNIGSANTLELLLNRIKRTPEFLKTRNRSKLLQRQVGYVYLQKYISNDGFDLKVVAVNQKVTFFGRKVRHGDFRASGGGNIFYDNSIISNELLDMVFDAVDRLKLQCVGFDVVIDRYSGQAKIIEMSYNFSHKYAMQAEGYYDRDKIWHSEPLNVPAEILKLLKII
jgi:glutathione synthase/RimK-type ligase-like ATP-grasp enzyme